MIEELAEIGKVLSKDKAQLFERIRNNTNTPEDNQFLIKVLEVYQQLTEKAPSGNTIFEELMTECSKDEEKKTR